MADLSVHREHQLGLEKARKVAQDWASYAEKKLDMRCTVRPGTTEDVIDFNRSGVSGSLRVTGSRFDLDAKLGLLFKAFAGKIEAETCKMLDEALAREAGKKG